ncbi:hypothetical protein BS47DRAFT_1363785 [Hydnum rufescens UP504]|uniref:Actin-like ATPase domain-containing protein n=1 Tax=Hydnum rufescens UP504 TaxID=1448309 RepID=A0A9P6ATS8_9AGAM|nr:hypothetical protein BS47DRAFT_1363785 [Hydnum rufescens UP504]
MVSRAWHLAYCDPRREALPFFGLSYGGWVCLETSRNADRKEWNRGLGQQRQAIVLAIHPFPATGPGAVCTQPRGLRASPCMGIGSGVGGIFKRYRLRSNMLLVSTSTPSFLLGVFQPAPTVKPDEKIFATQTRRVPDQSIPDLCSYIKSTPPARISLLKWCKGRNGLRHEFLLLKVDRAEKGGTIWLRLERRAHESAIAANCIISSVLSGDTVKLGNDFLRLFNASQSEVRVEAEFTIPLPLETLRTLLSALMKESPDYKLYSALIYETLVSASNGVNVAGAPSKFSNSFAPKAKARIKKRMASSFSEPSDGPPRPHLLTSQEAFDPRIEHEPSPHNQISASDRPSSVIESGDAVRPGIPDIPPHVRPDGLQGTRKNIPAGLGPSYGSPLRERAGIVSSMKSVRIDPASDMRPGHPEVRPDLTPGRGGISVGINFGTAHSGVAVAYGISPHTIEQMLWPGANRKVPTCLVYDTYGRVAAWGHMAQGFRLPEGWIRCETFKLLFGPTGGSDLIPGILPLGKQPIDVMADYLRELWRHVKPKILKRGNSEEDLAIPATWNVRNGEMMRDAAYAAGLPAPRGSQKGAGGRNQLHIISEPEACAVRCLLWRDVELKPKQSFMLCDAGGDTVDTVIFQVLGNVTHISPLCASSASCGLHFLDIHFRAYLEEWHRTRGIELNETNLAYYMDAFTYSRKLRFTGKQDEGDLLFDCPDVFDYYSTDLSDDEFSNGQLVVPSNDLRVRVFKPVVTEVLSFLEAQLKRVDSVDALFLVGEFSASPYLFDRIWDTFHRPIEAPTIIAPKSYIVGIGPNLAIRPGRNWNSGNTNETMNDFNGVFVTRYLVVKGASLKTGEPVLQEFTKTSYDPSEIWPDTNGGDLEHILDWEIDLSDIALFKQNAQNSRYYFKTIFKIGIEVESQSTDLASWRSEILRYSTGNATGIANGERLRYFLIHMKEIDPIRP